MKRVLGLKAATKGAAARLRRFRFAVALCCTASAFQSLAQVARAQSPDVTGVPTASPAGEIETNNPKLVYAAHTSLSSPQASYELEVRLDPAQHRLIGKGQVSLRNATPKALDALYFHLYLNAFTPQFRTAHALHAGRSHDTPGLPGEIRVTALRDLRDGGVLLPPAEAPADQAALDALDETELRVSLPKPIAAGETASFALEWSATLPSLSERTGYVEDYYFVGQWFPKLAKLDAQGDFVHFAFDPRAEFYADFGDYRVTIEAPQRFVIAASGQRLGDAREAIAVNSEAAFQRVTYEANQVHDFAWTAWPHYAERQANVSGVNVLLLYPPGYERAAERSLDALRFGLPFFAERYGPYPYPQLTVVYPPEFAPGATGMEYPQLITTGGYWIDSQVWPGFRDVAIEQVTLHELGHQWFYGLLASDEHRFPFLDEGLTTYAELQALDAYLGAASAGTFFGYPLSAALGQRALGLRAHLNYAVLSPVSDFPNFETLGQLAYSRSASVLETFRRVYADALDRGLSNYAARFRFAHPSPQDLLDSLEPALGAPAVGVLRTALTERAFVDYLVAGFESRRDASSNQFQHQVELVRRGNLSFPVSVVLRETDGTLTQRQWDGVATHWTLEFTSNAELESVELDPEHRVFIDENFLNNAETKASGNSLVVLEQLAFWLSSALNWLGT